MLKVNLNVTFLDDELNYGKASGGGRGGMKGRSILVVTIKFS